MFPVIERNSLCRTGHAKGSRISYRGAASNLMARDYKDGRDLIQEDNNMEGQDRKYVLRRLTPIECARLQGFPDWWCDGADGSDSAQYKLWGNGVSLPTVCDVLGRIAEEVRNENA